MGRPPHPLTIIDNGTCLKVNLTKGEWTRVDYADRDLIEKDAWCAHQRPNTTYACRGRKKRLVYLHVLIVQRMFPGLQYDEVDHVDHDGLNNLRENLRPSSVSGNRSNILAHRDSRSRFLGVDFHQGKWRARISKKKQSVFLGYFDSEADAAKAYDRASLHTHGEFANLNFPI